MSVERWIVTGASGQLGGHLLTQIRQSRADAVILALAGKQPVALDDILVARVELTQSRALGEAIRSFRPTHVIHAGAMTAVGACHKSPETALRINLYATGQIADAAEKVAARLLFTSTDMVFAGENAPYDEDATPDAQSVYGRSKADAEQVLRNRGNTLVVRVPLMYGLPLTSRESTFANQLSALRRGEPPRLFTDEFRTPISLRDAARALIGLCRSDATGLIHVAGTERLSRYVLIERCAAVLGIAAPRLEPVSRLSIDSPEPRPEDLSLDASRFLRDFPKLAPGPISAESIAGDS